jgi:hypothetical protein
MSQLVFQANAGGSITLTGTNTAGSFNLIVPADNGTLLYEDNSGNISVTNLDVTGELTITGTSALGIPVGNTVQRPSPVEPGQIRYNTDGGGLYEGYLPSVTAWYKFSMVPQGQYTISYLMVAGGGGAADVTGTLGTGQGGGGAGGATTNSFTALPSTSYNIVIGAGGTAQATGNNSFISGIQTVYGGGAGNAGAGGSGGGGGGNGAAGGGVVSPGQGNIGGAGSAFWGSGGGGGGAGAAGTGGAYVGGNGGAGISNTLTGTTVYYAGGGGGIGQFPDQLPGSAGIGGGGANAGNGVVNTGGGGGGGRGGGGAGGSGIVILSIPTASYSGNITGLPIVTTVGANTIVQYTQSGTYIA